MPARTTGSGGASAQAILAPSAHAAAAFFQQPQQAQQHTGKTPNILDFQTTHFILYFYCC